MNLRVLHPDTDKHLYRQAWQWRRAYPRLVRKWDGLKHFNPWFKRLKCRVSVGVFTTRLVALVTLRAAGGDTYEIDVDCERRVDRQVLLTALLNIRRTVFEDWEAREVFAGVVSRNSGILRIARQCGFTPDGVTEQAGKLKFIRLRMTDREFYENKHLDRLNHQHLHASTGSVESRHRQIA